MPATGSYAAVAPAMSGVQKLCGKHGCSSGSEITALFDAARALPGSPDASTTPSTSQRFTNDPLETMLPNDTGSGTPEL